MYPAQRIRGIWLNKSGVDDPMAGEVKVDEVHQGEKEKNKHANEKLRTGKGAVGKAPVAGVCERKSGRSRPTSTATSRPSTASARSTWAATWTSCHPHNRRNWDNHGSCRPQLAGHAGSASGYKVLTAD